MPVDVEIGDVAVDPLPHHIGQPANASTSPSPRQSASTAGAVVPALPARKATKTVQQIQATIARAESRLQTLLSSQDSGTAPKKQSARTREKQLAAFTGDREFLKHGSDKVRSEANSEDDADEIAAEQGDAIHCHNLMHPSSKAPVKNRLGYVLNSFIKGDDEPSSESGDSDSPQDGLVLINLRRSDIF